MYYSTMREHAFAGEPQYLAADLLNDELHIGIVCINERIVGKLLERMETKTQPVLVSLPFGLVAVGRLGKRELVGSVEEVGTVEAVELDLHAIFVMRVLENLEERIVEKSLRPLSSQVTEKPDYVVDVEYRTLS